MTDTNQKEHYYLVAAEVIHHPAADSSQLAANKLNTVLTTKEQVVGAKDLGRAQAGIQQQLHMKTQGREVKVLDVVILTVTHLGYMTATEFFGEDPAKSDAPKPPAKPASTGKKRTVK